MRYSQINEQAAFATAEISKRTNKRTFAKAELRKRTNERTFAKAELRKRTNERTFANANLSKRTEANERQQQRTVVHMAHAQGTHAHECVVGGGDFRLPGFQPPRCTHKSLMCHEKPRVTSATMGQGKAAARQARRQAARRQAARRQAAQQEAQRRPERKTRPSAGSAERTAWAGRHAASCTAW